MNEPVLVLVHGYPFDHTLWDFVVRLLPKKFLVLAPDLRGFGGPSTSGVEPSLDRVADDLKALLDSKGVERAVIAGMSMGGYVALAFAERHRERLAGLALISTQAAADSEEARANRRSMIEKVHREGPRAAAEAAIPKMFAPENAVRPELLRFPNEGAVKAGVEGIAWAQEAMARRPDRTSVLRALDVPVLVAHGLADKFVPIERARELAKLPKQGQFLELVSAGHATPLEAPDRLAEAFTRLVERSFASS